MKRVLQTIVRDNERYSISNSSELSLSKPDLYIEKIELQGGATATTEDIVVTRSGKNLFDKSLVYLKSGYDLANCTLIATTENGWIIKGNDYNQTGNALYYNGWLRALDYEYLQGRGIYLNKGDIVTVSADYTVLENPYPNSSYPANIYLYGDKSQTSDLSKLPPLNITERRSKTFTISASGRYYPVFTLNSATIKIENIQVEIGSAVTEYEPYLPPKSLTFSSAYPLSSTDKLSITINSVKYNDTDITSEVTGLDEFFSIDADVSTITTSANIALGEITEDISYSVKSNKRAIYTGENIVYSSQTFIKE